MILGLLGGAAKGIGRDLGMGFGLTERDQDYFDRTRETLRKQYGDDRAALYERQTAAQRAAAPKGRVENPRRSEKGILSTIIGDLKLGLPNRNRSTRATSRGSGSDMSSSLRPMTRPMMSSGYDDAPLQMMQRNMMLGPFASDPRLNMTPFSNDVRGPDRGIIGVPDPEPVTSGLIAPTFEQFLEELGIDDTEENRDVFFDTYIQMFPPVDTEGRRRRVRR